MAELAVGANLPWTDHGLDSGAYSWPPEGGLARPPRRDRLRTVRSTLAPGTGAPASRA